jgi:predicted ATPase
MFFNINQMTNQIYPKWSEWRKWDLHFHTNASYDCSSDDSKIINALSKADVSVIAITDHHHIDLKKIQNLQAEGKKNNITIFPWIEFLSTASWREPVHYIAIFPENCDIDHIRGQISNKTNISKIKWEGKKHNAIYCDLETTGPIIKELWGIITIHAWSKSNSIENITHSLPQSIAQKESYAQIIDLFEIWKIEDIENYKTKVIPFLQKKINRTHWIIICSDNHDIWNYKLKENLWIKADPTFEWLQEAIYEPVERIIIQSEKPQQKSWYDYIESIRISHADIHNKELYLHQNLTAIIGWRSSWKSLLLALIARKFTDINPKPNNEKKYNSYVNSIADSTTITRWNWLDNLDNMVDYFPQEEISRLSRLEDSWELSSDLRKKIRWILEKNDLYQITEKFDDFCFTNKNLIEGKISELFRIKNNIYEKKQWIKQYTSKSNIEEEIEKINISIRWISTLTEEQVTEFKKTEAEVDANNTNIENLEKQIQYLNENKIEKNFINNFYWELDDKYETILTEKANELNNYIKTTFNQTIQNIISDIEKDIWELKTKNINLKKWDSYILWLANIEHNNQLIELDKKLKNEKKKINEIEQIEKEIEMYETEFEKQILEIKKLNKAYLEKAVALIQESVAQEKNKLKIMPYIKCERDQLESYLRERINQKSDENKQRASFQWQPLELQSKLLWLFDEVLSSGWLTLNWTFEWKEEQFCKWLLSWTFINIDFSLTYDWIEFDQMSEGKRAFVILQLLLDFSDKTWPILIDQPEDDLDNRSISYYLAEYLKDKKKDRQIIIVTHNANIVLWADAEMVIVANQHWEWTINTDHKKFEYLQWSIENTYKNENESRQLHKMWIREHICDILEWWEEAFQERKKKYNFI